LTLGIDGDSSPLAGGRLLYSLAVRCPLVLATCLVAVCALVRGASAQHPPLGVPDPRPLHVQLRAADAVAIATVAAVELGRVRLVDTLALAGELPAAFELKRAPSAPPPLSEGDRVLLLLRGARTPYVWASEPAELILLADASESGAWKKLLRQLLEPGDGANLVRSYATGLDQAPLRVQRESAIGLAHEDCPGSAIRPPTAARLAELAAVGADPPLRRFSARAAVRTPEGRRALLERVPTDDPEVLITALGSAGDSEPETLTEALLRALRHESVAIRATALRQSRTHANDRRVRAQIVHISSEDPEERLRRLARRLMKGE
jgi:hypothetical protein